MPTTSNFGWTTPADTDLVKDGAAAIRTLGNGIDTSLVDLKGGTTGQILSKTSNTDLDFTWIANDQGDITAVTAGTGLTGGGTTGAVTITNDMATTITAAGDIVVGTGNASYDNLPIGTTGQVLTADTTVSPYKVKWAAVAATPTSGSAAVDSAQSTTSTSYTNLTTTGPEVTLTTGTKAIAIMNCNVVNDGTGNSFVDIAVSGATTVTPNDLKGITIYNQQNKNFQMGAIANFTGLTAGSNTFTMKYRVSANTGYFSNRQLLVIDLGS